MGNILIIDDDECIRELYRYILTDIGCTVETAASGGEALEKLGRRIPDCMIVDFSMPGMDAGEFITTLSRDPRKELGNIPFIVLTGATGECLSRCCDLSRNPACRGVLHKMTAPDLVADAVKGTLKFK